MANPRKFSEKIALHTHRQAEETARFEQIMREVSDATARVTPDRSAKNTLRINTQTLGTFRGGSLPNVSAGAPTVKSTTQNTESTKPSEEVAQHQPMTNYRTGSRTRSPVGPIRRPHDRKLDTSPYSSGTTFLSPPPDTSWRRTNSDSALHQSTMQGMNMIDRNDNSNRSWIVPTMNGPDRTDGRPRSSCEVPRVPGINICPSAHEPGLIQIPMSGNNTGSLPDLTNVDFSSPIHAPLDQDQDSSPYSSSPVNTSPSTLSPTSIPQGLRNQGRFQFTPVSHAHSNQLSVPVNSRYLQQHRKNVPLDKNFTGYIDGVEYTQLANINMYQQQCSPTSQSPTLQQAASYRSPRPSPQSSPSLGGRHSAPCSPGAPSPLPNEYHLLNQQTAQFQQHFEQLSMDWAQLVASLMESGCTWSAQLQLDTPVSSMSYVDQSPSGQMTHSQTHSQSRPEPTTIDNIEITSDAGYYSTSPSQLVYPTPSPGLHTTPNTPTSIPDITLTDFSAGDDVRQFDSELFAESLREGLVSLDFDEMQMLANPSISLPESVEEHFKLDHS